MMIRTVIAALPLVLVLSGCSSSATAPEATRRASYSSVAPDTIDTDTTTATVASDTTSLTGGPMGSGS
ncbi:hypothetical protein [Longimicrobium sp.]|jgi:uncharacterized protein YceK|uniref:hypothetical protein n=1 Tax=Longimicrobium sp. TaxID=2029185 RepID=UPI002F932D47